MNKKTVLILGATCKVGQELCKIYANNNYNLILISRNVKKNIDLKEMLLFKFPEIEIDTYELDILNLEDQTKIYENLKVTPDGIISLIVVEVGLITPPVGMNVFVISSMAKDVPMIETFKGVIPFFLSDAVRVAFIVWLPSLTLFLPHLLMAD